MVYLARSMTEVLSETVPETNPAPWLMVVLAVKSCANRVLDASEYRIKRKAHVVRAELPLKGIALAAAKWTGSKRRFRGGTERADIHGIFERIVVDTILGISRTAGRALEADHGEGNRIVHGVVIDNAIRG